MKPSNTLNYLSGYSPEVQQQVQSLIDNEKTGPWLLKKYPQAHEIGSERALYDYAQAIKNHLSITEPPPGVGLAG